MPEDKPIIVAAEQLKRFEAEAFERAGLTPDNAVRVADTLLQADLRGVHSHGALHLLRYCRRLRGGGANPRPDIKVVRETDSTALVDGDNGLGQMVSMRTMEVAMAKAKGKGIAAVAAFRSNHYGAGAYYPMMAAAQGFIAYGTTNAPAMLAPTGGLTPMLGNNPVTYAIPAGKEPMIVLDMALSVAARGKIRVAAGKGVKIPKEWATDKYGEPTDDPVAALEGLLLPVGGYKGYGMIVVGEILCGVMTGANFGPAINVTLDNTDTPWNIGHFFTAIDVEAFMGRDEFNKRVDDLVKLLKNVPKAKGYDRIYVPGEPEHILWQEHMKSGIPLQASTIDDLKTVAKEFGVTAPLPG